MTEKTGRLQPASSVAVPQAPSVLLALYGLFALAAGARSAVQLLTRAHVAPIAYALSAVAAVIYLGGAVALRLRTSSGRRLATALAVTELCGVVVVGTISLLVPRWFPEASVWSEYGIGYGFVPLLLPVITLFWIRRSDRPAASRP